MTGAFSPDGRRLAVALDPDITETAGARAAEVLVIEVADGRLRRARSSWHHQATRGRGGASVHCAIKV